VIEGSTVSSPYQVHYSRHEVNGNPT